MYLSITNLLINLLGLSWLNLALILCEGKHKTPFVTLFFLFFLYAYFRHIFYFILYFILLEHKYNFPEKICCNFN